MYTCKNNPLDDVQKGHNLQPDVKHRSKVFSFNIIAVIGQLLNVACDGVSVEWPVTWMVIVIASSVKSHTLSPPSEQSFQGCYLSDQISHSARLFFNIFSFYEVKSTVKGSIIDFIMHFRFM